MKSFLSKPFFMSTDSNPPLDFLPAHVYLITGTGINRIFDNLISDQTSADFYFGSQFSATTYFPGRPYFQEALVMPINPLVKEEGPVPPSRPKVKDYFHVSRPYMDLAGNGIVVTASRLVAAHRTCPAVLCFDFRLQGTHSLSDTLLSTLDQFNAPRVTVGFRVNTYSNYVVKWEIMEPSSGPRNQVQMEVIDRAVKFIQRSGGDLSQFFGNIQLINYENVLANAPLQVSIPVGEVGSQGREKFGKFLLFQLDLARYRHITDVIGLLGCAFLALFSVVVVSGLVLATQRNDDLAYANKELRQAFESVGEVLWDAPVPYAQLDSQDRVRNCNKAMCDFLGYEYQELLSKRFRDDLVQPEDRPKYDGVQERRRDHEPVEPYSIRFCTAGDAAKSAWIVAAEVPPIGAQAGALPETFGVFLRDKPSGLKVLQMDKTKAA